MTYSTLATITPAVTADTFLVPIPIYAGWYIKVTATNVTINASAYA